MNISLPPWCKPLPLGGVGGGSKDQQQEGPDHLGKDSGRETQEEVERLKLAEGLIDRGVVPGFGGVEEGEKLYHKACRPKL